MILALLPRLLGAVALAGFPLVALAQTEDATLNDLANYSTYGGAVGSAVGDADAVAGSAFRVDFAGPAGGAFDAALQISQAAAPADAPGAVHEVTFRYRAAAARTLVFWTTSREVGDFSGVDDQWVRDGQDASYYELAATTEWQTFTAAVTSPQEAGAPEHLVHLQFNAGNDTVPFFVDAIGVETEAPPAPCDEDAVFNDLDSYNFYGDFAVAEEVAEGGVCDDLFDVQYVGETGDGDFSAAFQILEGAGADDGPGAKHTVSFRYKADAERELIFYTRSRLRGTFGDDDGDFAEGTFFALSAGTEWQTFTQELTSLREDAGDYHVYMMWPSGDDTTAFQLDDIAVATEGDAGDGINECGESALNDAANYTSFRNTATIAPVADPRAVCGDAIAVTLSGEADDANLFAEGIQLNRASSLDDTPGNEYRLTLRYRGDAPDTAALYVPSRKEDGGDVTAYFADLFLDTAYQTLTAEFASPRDPGEVEQFIYVSFGVGGLSTTLYVDSFSLVQTNEPCDEGILSLPASFSAFSPDAATVDEVDDAAGECGDAIRVCNTGDPTPGNDFSQGLQIVDARRLNDLPGKRFRLSFRYRKDGAEPLSTGVFFSSRTPDNAGAEVNTSFASLTITEEYQVLDFEFDSALEPGQSNRLVHWSLGIGETNDCVYLDDVQFEDITPARETNTTFYVLQAGSDGNTGRGDNADEAFATIAFALTQLIPGDTLVINDGIYREVGLELSGLVATAEAPTVIKSATKWGAKIEGTTQFDVLFQVRDCEHVIVDGLEVYHPGESTDDDWATGIQTFGSDYVTVRNSYAHDCGCGGFSGREGDYLTFERNVARANAKTSPFNCSGISIYQPVERDQAPGPHIVIRDNVVFDNECRLAFTPLGFTVPTDGNGIILDDFEQTQSFGDEPNPYDPFRANTLVENNLAFRNGGAGIKAFEVASVTIRSNTVWHNNYVLEEFTGNVGEIGLQTITGATQVYNNIAVKAFGQRGNALYFSRDGDEDGEAASLLATGNIFVGPNQLVSGERVVTGNTQLSEDRQSFPAFANATDSVGAFAGVDDFRALFGLRPGSPALDAAVAPELPAGLDPGPATDLTGVPRPVGDAPDLGAFEGAVDGDGPLAPDPTLVAESELTPAPMNVDGVRDGFYTGPTQVITKNLAEAPEDDADLSAAWVSGYNADNLYLFVAVDDADVVAGDAVRVFVDGGNEKSDAYDVNDAAYVVNADGTSGGGLDAVAVATTQTGYAVEVALAWSTIGATPADSARIGIDVVVEDADAADGAPESRLSWQAITAGAESDPSLFGELLLLAVEPPPAIAQTFDTVALDGVLDAAYDSVAVYDLGIEVQPTIDSPTDLSATWRSVWDSTNLYFYVEVADDAIVDDSEQWFNDDGVEIYIDADNSKTFNAYDLNDYQIVVETNGAVFDTKGQLGEGAEASVTLTDTGYVVEVALPWTALGASPEAGLFIGLDVHAIDDDTGDSRDGKLSWFAEIDQSFANAGLFGTAYLAPADAVDEEPNRCLPGTIEAETFAEVERGSATVVDDDEGDAAVLFERRRTRVSYPVVVKETGLYRLAFRASTTRRRGEAFDLYVGNKWWNRRRLFAPGRRFVPRGEYAEATAFVFLKAGETELDVRSRRGGTLRLDAFEGHLVLALDHVEDAPTEQLTLPPADVAGFVVYPNPASGEVFVAAATAERLDVSVLDLSGRVVFARSGVSPANALDVSGLTEGVYLVRATADGEQYTRKLVIRP